MNKDYQLDQLRRILENPEQKSGLYLLDTDLTDEELEAFIKGIGLCSYRSEERRVGKEC